MHGSSLPTVGELTQLFRLRVWNRPAGSSEPNISASRLTRAQRNELRLLLVGDPQNSYLVAPKFLYMSYSEAQRK